MITAFLTAPQAAAQNDARVAVAIDSISTPIIDTSDPEQIIRLSGTVTNTSETDLRYLSVHFWRSVEPITTSDELAGILASPPAVPVGSRMADIEGEGRHFQLITEEDAPFPAGQTRSFTVEATVGELGFTSDDVVYLLGVQVRVVGLETIGRARLLAPATQADLPRTDIVQLSSRPSRTANGNFLDDRLAQELTGDLMELTRDALNGDATVLVDPALVAEIQALTSPHTIDEVVREPVPEASEWLQSLEELIADGRVMRLPYGEPHLPRLYSMGRLDQFLDLAHHHTPAALEDLPLATNLGATATTNLLEELAARDFDYVFAENLTSGLVDGMQVIELTSPARPGIGPAPDDTYPNRQGRRLAEQLLAEHPPVHLVRTPDEFDELHTDLDRETQVPPQVTNGRPVLMTADLPVPWPDLLAEVDDLREHAAFVADLTGIDEAQVLEWAALGSFSTAWDSESEALAFLRATPLAQADPEQITIHAVGQFVMGSRTNDFPVTITNGMDEAVRVRLRFTSDVPQRIAVPATDLVDIEAGESQTLNIAPTATSNGVVQVIAQLETAGGARFGQEVPIQITATDLGRVGWIIIIVSGAVVLGGTFLRIRAVRAEKAKESSEQSG